MEVTLRAETGRPQGSRPSRRLRRAGRVPAVVYGKDIEPKAIAVDRRELYGALHTDAGLNALINLEIDGGNNQLTMAKAVGRHPVRGEIIHVDFVTISLTETTRVDVALELQGDPVGVASCPTTAPPPLPPHSRPTHSLLRQRGTAPPPPASPALTTVEACGIQPDEPAPLHRGAGARSECRSITAPEGTP